jgi:hypothetical protein
MPVNQDLKRIHYRFNKHNWRRVGVISQFHCDIAVCTGCGSIVLLAANSTPVRQMDVEAVGSKSVLRLMQEACTDPEVKREIELKITKLIY